MKHLTYLIIAATLATPTLTQAQTTQKLSATKAEEYALIYNLPANEFEISLKARCTRLTPGEFYQYARVYLNADPIMRPSTTWELTDAAITELAIPDPDERYLVQFKAGAPVFINATRDNIPLSINIPAEVPELQTTGFTTTPFSPTVLDSSEASYAITPEMTAATSLGKRAELAAARIFEIRQTRSELIAGQSENQPTDGAAIKLMLDNLAQQEAVLTAMFMGTTQTCTASTSVRYTPGDEDESMVIARLSVTKGFTDVNDLSGIPVYIHLAVEERGALPVNEKGEVKRFPKGGVAYRIPGRAALSVTCGDREYASLSCPVAQYGVVFGIDPALFYDKKVPAYLIFDPMTGAIRELGALSPK